MIFSAVPHAVFPNAEGSAFFNRSYYEEVLAVRVHRELLRSKGLAQELHNDKNIWVQRYGSIVDLESPSICIATLTSKRSATTIAQPKIIR